MSKIKVTTMSTELELIVPRKTKGRDLFLQISRDLGLHELWYFGMMYFDANRHEIWFDGSKKTIADIGSHAVNLKYRVKYYPEDVSQELIEDVTIASFYYQVRSAILSNQIYCPPDTCVLLASYASQVRHGNYHARIHKNGFLRKEKILPQRIYDQFKIKRDTWEENVMKMWQKHSGMLSEDAMLEYLKIAQNLEMFGVSYYEISNKKGSDLLLGVDALGLNIYRREDRLNPTIAFPWSEIKNINFKGTKFTIKPTDSQSKLFTFYSAEAITNKYILNLSIGNHALYMRRRKKDTLEVQQMKAKAAQQRKYKLEERAKLLHETLAREQAEKREQQYQDEIRALKEAMDRSNSNLNEAHITIHKLQEQLRQLQIAKQVLEDEQNNLRLMMERLEYGKTMEAMERQKLIEEIQRKQSQVQKIQNQVAQKSEETQKLQHEIEEANRREQLLREQQEITRRKNQEAHELEVLADANNKLPSLVEVNDQLKDDLKTLQQQLNATRDESKDTELDKIYRKNLQDGRDKYKTLNEIRKGNTVRRVDMFENIKLQNVDSIPRKIIFLFFTIFYFLLCPVVISKSQKLPKLEGLDRLLHIPVVEFGYNYAGHVYSSIKESNGVFHWAFGQAESSFQFVVTTTLPSATLIEGPVITIDKLLFQSLDVVQTMVPQINLPPQELFSSGKEYVTNKLVRPILQRADSVLDSKYTAIAADTLEGALLIADKYVDKYLPDDVNENETNEESRVANTPTEKAYKTIHHVDTFSRKLQRRLTLRTLAEAKALKEHSTEAVHVFKYILDLVVTDPKLALQKGQELWSSLSKDEPENQARPENIEQLLVMLTRESSRRIVHLINFTNGVIVSLPDQIKTVSTRLINIVDHVLKGVHLDGKNKPVIDFARARAHKLTVFLYQLNVYTTEILEQLAKNLEQQEQNIKNPSTNSKKVGQADQNHGNHHDTPKQSTTNQIRNSPKNSTITNGIDNSK